jgi:cyanophycin synthetase
VLVNPFVDAMVLETNELRVIQEGLAFDRCDVAVVTNLATQASAGEETEGDRALVAKAIRAPVDVVLPEGCAILNADEPEVAAMAEKCRGRTLLFARDGQSAPIREHLAKGGQAVFVAEGVIVAAQRDQSLPMFDLAAVAGLPLGPPPEALLAAVGAGVALKLTQTAVSQGVSAALGLLAKTP